MLLEEGGRKFIWVHRDFGFIVGVEPCDFLPYCWHLEVSVVYLVGHVPWCVGRQSENFVLQSYSILMFDWYAVSHNGMP